MSTATAPAQKEEKEKRGSPLRQELLVPALAVLTGLIFGAIVILASGENPIRAYGALFTGSFGSPARLIEGLQVYFSTGETRLLLRAVYPFTESLVTEIGRAHV